METVILDHGIIGDDKESAVEQFFWLIDTFDSEYDPDPELKISEMVYGDKRYIVFGRFGHGHNEILSDVGRKVLQLPWEWGEVGRVVHKGGAFARYWKEKVCIDGRSETLGGGISEEAKEVAIAHLAAIRPEFF